MEAEDRQALSLTIINQLTQQVPVRRTIPAFFRTQNSDTTHFVMTDEFSVKFKPDVSRAEIDSLNEKYGVEVAPLDNEIDRRQAREYNEYPLRVTEASALNALEAANRYYESELTVWSVPTFHVNLQREGRIQPRSSANDPLYPKQYYLNNTSSNLGTADVDIDAPEAWALSKGSSSITVAVVDDGVEQHEDFRSGQVINGRTAGGGDGSPSSASQHGQAVAGIIAANHNTKGVRGVAPNVKIMPINIFDGPYGEPTSNAIDYAWQNGADVLSNSWGGPPNDEVEAALTRARQDGRNGKGSVVVKSAGNTGNDVTFPATIPGLLVVGAVDKDDNVWYYSPRDDEVAIVAPSGDVGGNGDVRTSDRVGGSGYEPDATACDETDDADEPENYYGCFGGTSAAAPQASGTAALMLSANSSLTESDVRSDIETNADDYGNTNWDGAGRLNARQSVEDALPPPNAQIISGPIKVKEGETATWEASVSGGSGSYAISWKKQRKSGDSWLGTCGTSLTCTTSFRDTDDETTDNGGIRVVAFDEVTNATGVAERSVTIYPNDDGGGGGCNAVTGNQICLSSESKTSALGAEALPDTVEVGTVAPNPVRSQARLSVALPERASVEVALYNTVGQQVRRHAATRPAGRHAMAIGVEGLPSGVYFARVTVGDVTTTRRIVVVR
ncbi:S8 family peptidase [Salinibacter altiplanensis]|uniref:S8 family peptidase n=1 Tax=Salinibacter altiplanensis TaxID=1803181 RepID=UPI000C9F768C|nr:S8 family peptidase [Salinibacter altiplanensis]